MRLGKKQSNWIAILFLLCSFLGGIYLLKARERSEQLSPEEELSLLRKYQVPEKANSTNQVTETPTPQATPSLFKPSNLANLTSASPSPSSAFGAFRLANFQRSELKGGKRLWEVEAEQGEYIPGTNKIQLKNPSLWMQKDDGTSIRMRSLQGTLTMEGNTLMAAELKGQVVLIKDDKTTLKTEFANYDRNKALVRCPGFARIEQDRVSIEGENLTANLNSKSAEFAKNVVTTILPKDDKET